MYVQGDPGLHPRGRGFLGEGGGGAGGICLKTHSAIYKFYFQMKILKRVGGHKLRNKVDRCLSKLFSPIMLTRLNMRDQRGEKTAFIDTKLAKVLVKAVLDTCDDSVTEAHIGACLASILKGASARKAAKQN